MVAGVVVVALNGRLRKDTYLLCRNAIDSVLGRRPLAVVLDLHGLHTDEASAAVCETLRGHLHRTGTPLWLVGAPQPLTQALRAAGLGPRYCWAATVEAAIHSAITNTRRSASPRARVRDLRAVAGPARAATATGADARPTLARRPTRLAETDPAPEGASASSMPANDPVHRAGIEEAFMTDVLAIVRPGPDEATVPQAAQAVAKILHAQVRELWTTPEPGDLSARSADRALHDPEVVLVVVGRDLGDTSTWARVARRADMPVVVVPSSPGYSPGAIGRVLVPLDGSPDAGHAVAGALAAFAHAGAELVVLVVATATTGPRCIDHVPWGYLDWEDQFLATYCAHPRTRMLLSAGDPGAQITRTAATEQVDLITLSWSRPLRPDRAAIVHHTVRTATVPVLLIPTDQHCDPFRLSA
jgi:hypothetical protein